MTAMNSIEYSLVLHFEQFCSKYDNDVELAGFVLIISISKEM